MSRVAGQTLYPDPTQQEHRVHPVRAAGIGRGARHSANKKVAAAYLRKKGRSWYRKMWGNIVLLSFMMEAVGVFSQTPVLPSCTGDTIVYNCTVDSASHTWRTCAFCLGFDIEVSRRIPDPSSDDRRFTFALVNRDINSGPIISSMTVTSFDDLDDSAISCLNSLDVNVNQDVNIAILGAMGNITTTGFTNTISTMASTTTILRKTPADGSCEDIGSGEILRGNGTLSDVLSCGLAGLPVTYCYCSPIGGASNTTILVPTLIANAISTSSTPDVLSLIVDVNDCIGMEQLRVRVTVNGGGIPDPLEMIKPYSRRSDFTFSDLSPGKYTCSVSVEDENGVQESRNISCIAPGGLTNDEMTIIISVVLPLVVIILISIGVVTAIGVSYWYYKNAIAKKRTEQEWEDGVRGDITAFIDQRRGAIKNPDELLTKLKTNYLRLRRTNLLADNAA